MNNKILIPKVIKSSKKTTIKYPIISNHDFQKNCIVMLIKYVPGVRFYNTNLTTNFVTERPKVLSNPPIMLLQDSDLNGLFYSI